MRLGAFDHCARPTSDDPLGQRGPHDPAYAAELQMQALKEKRRRRRNEAKLLLNYRLDNFFAVPPGFGMACGLLAICLATPTIAMLAAIASLVK